MYAHQVDGGDCLVVFVVVFGRSCTWLGNVIAVCDGKEAHFIAFAKHNQSPNAKIEFENEKSK